jgi:hypothetical protein
MPLAAKHTAHRTPENVNLLKLAATPLLIWVISGDAGRAIVGASVFALVMLASHYITQGIRQQNGERVELGAHWPRKTLGAGILGFAIFLLAWAQLDRVLLAVALGGVGFSLSLLAFGLDHVTRAKRRVKKSASSDETERFMETAERVLNAVTNRLNTLEQEDLTAHALMFREQFIEMTDRNWDLLDDLIEEIRNAVTQVAMETDSFYLDYQETPDPEFKRRYIRTLGDISEELSALFDAHQNEYADIEQNSDKLFDQMSRKSVA